MTFIDSFRYADTPNLDAFGRLRVSNPVTLFDSKQIYDNQPLFWDEELESGASITSAHSTDTASTVITSTTNTAGVFTRQTFMRMNYQPGKSLSIFMTGILDRSGGGTGIERRIGYFDDNNGIFFEDDAGTIGVTRRTFVTGSAVDTTVAQASWNVDVMDGSGASGVTVDWTKMQIFAMDFEWLGTGRVRMCLIVAGVIHPVHEFLNANVLDKVYVSTPNLPVRYQMITANPSAASTMECVCATVTSEGGTSDLGVLRYKSTAGTHVDCATENLIYAIVGIRLKAATLGSEVHLISMSMAEFAGSAEIEWLLLWDPTVAGTFTYGDENNSSVQTATGTASSTVTGGTKLTGGHFLSAGGASKGGGTRGDLENSLRLGADISGNVDSIVLCARPINGSSAIDIEGSLSWRESP